MIDYQFTTEIARQRHQDLIQAVQKERQLRELQANRRRIVRVPLPGLIFRLMTVIRRLKRSHRYDIAAHS